MRFYHHELLLLDAAAWIHCMLACKLLHALGSHQTDLQPRWCIRRMQGACPEDRLSQSSITQGYRDSHEAWGITDANETTLSLRNDPSALARLLAPSFKQVRKDTQLPKEQHTYMHAFGRALLSPDGASCSSCHVSACMFPCASDCLLWPMSASGIAFASASAPNAACVLQQQVDTQHPYAHDPCSMF